MGSVQVTAVPADRDGKSIHVLHGDTVQRYTPIEFRLLLVRGERVIDGLAGLSQPRGGGMTDAQSRHLHALLRERRGASGDARFPVLTELVGREITSSRDLTKAEASLAIDRLLSVRPIRTPDEREAF